MPIACHALLRKRGPLQILQDCYYSNVLPVAFKKPSLHSVCFDCGSFISHEMRCAFTQLRCLQMLCYTNRRLFLFIKALCAKQYSLVCVSVLQCIQSIRLSSDHATN